MTEEVEFTQGEYKQLPAVKYSVTEEGKETKSLIIAHNHRGSMHLGDDIIPNPDEEKIFILENGKEVLSCSVDVWSTPTHIDQMSRIYYALSKKRLYDKLSGLQLKKNICKAFLDKYVFNTPESKEVLHEYMDKYATIEKERTSFHDQFFDLKGENKFRTEENKKLDKENKVFYKLAHKVAKEKEENMPDLYHKDCENWCQFANDHTERKSALQTRKEENEKLKMVKQGFTKRRSR